MRVLADLDALEEGASMLAREPTGVLRVIAHATAATSRITPLLASFKRKHPKIDIDVTLAERPVDLVAEGFDVGLLLPFMLTSDTVVTRLVERIPRRRRDRAASRVQLAHAAARQGADVHRPFGRILRCADAPFAARVTALAARSRHPGAAGAH
ncbi:hypothetical protein WJ55_12880 [Burkholderia ubonensis]|nr:LysR substrate-binding domain-containing protein [Burkholderia ubonensis]KVG70658.1 hypothetical protein WJ34_25235 [Burkholderia ubonensis]KVH25485.1 hypothetical protein WJ37_06925 [Burkholderia ubonensis]KVH45378.1 hypothetical protein WJ38_23905 [Burkholderia ubonensis]KVH80676.1 hypothetical protein WJ43_31425 [Burkholderia ubonensis]KVL78447.1 hypothetical protein WJ48_30235 [Burkholderia ubonensis]